MEMHFWGLCEFCEVPFPLFCIRCSTLIQILKLFIFISVRETLPHFPQQEYTECKLWFILFTHKLYEGWNFNSGNYLFTTDTK